MGSRSRRYATMISKDSDLTAFEKVERWFKAIGMEEYGGHDALLQSLMKLESATYEPTPEHPHHSTTVFSLVIPHALCNMTGNLHGGAVALIFDICTSTAITPCAKEGFWDTGHVSRTLNCTYLRPAAEGTKVFVESEVVHLGRRLAMTRAVMRNEEGKICYTCEHGKAAVGSSSL